MSVPERKIHIETDIKNRCDDAWTHVYPVHNQNFVVMSIVDVPDKNLYATKIFGTFSSIEEANKISKTISMENDFFNVYVASTNAWIPIPPTKESIENINYQEGLLTEIKDTYAALKERDAKNLVEQIKRDKEKVKEIEAEDVVEAEDGVEESKSS